MSTGNQDTPGPEVLQQLTRLMDGYLSTQLLYAAVRAGIPEALADGPRSAEDVQRATGLDLQALVRVLRGLVMDGLLYQTDDGRFGLSEAGELLRADAPGSVRGAVLVRGDLYYHAAAGILPALQGGGTPFESVLGADLFSYLRENPEKGSDFQASMAVRSRIEADAVAAAYDFSRYRRIVDVGGGRGVLLERILIATPNLRGVLFDLPDVIEQARAQLTASEVRERVDLVPGSFFEAIPGDADLYLLSRVIHDWDDADAVRILRSCREVMAAGTTLLLIEAVLPERVKDQPGAVRMDLHMFTLLGGRERTAAEFASVLEPASFELQRVIPVHPPTGLAIIEAQAK